MAYLEIYQPPIYGNILSLFKKDMCGQHNKSKGFDYGFIEYDDPGGRVTRQKKTDQNQMQPMHSSPSSQGSQLDHHSGHIIQPTPRLGYRVAQGLLPLPEMPVHPTIVTSDTDHHSNKTVLTFCSGAADAAGTKSL